MINDIVNLTEKYKAALDEVRQDTSLLSNYRFDKDALHSKHYDRLKLNIAIYNDRKQTDYEIERFLFTEEKEWRKHAKDGDVDNLYFCAFILSLFNSADCIWLFWESKNIDFDSGIGFDGEYLLSSGIKETYQYLKTVDNPKKQELLTYIGETEEHCMYSQSDIDNWVEFKHNYFRCYKYPLEDELFFLYSTDERELFLLKLPEWIKQERTWTREELFLFRTYAEYVGDKSLEIEAAHLIVEKNGKDSMNYIYHIELAGLYIDTGDIYKAYEILEKVIKGTDNNNIVRNCVEQLCRIVMAENSTTGEIASKSYSLISEQEKKYKSFSPKVDKLITVVTETMGKKINTPPSSAFQEAKRSWWRKFFGS